MSESKEKNASATILDTSISKFVNSEKETVCLESSADIQQAAKAMIDNSVGSVLVVDQEQRLLGIFTERDFLKASAEDGFLQESLSKYMTASPENLSMDDPLVYALNRMLEADCRHVPLVDADQCVKGLISLTDIVKYSERVSGELSISQSEQYIHPDEEAEGALPIASGSCSACSSKDVLACHMCEMCQGECGKDFIQLEGSATIKTAIAKMLEKNMSCVLISNADNKMEGIFSERDLVQSVVAGRTLDTALTEVMQGEVLTVSPQNTIREAVQLMIDQGARHLPCICDTGDTAGVIKMSDIISYWRDINPDDLLCLPPQPSHHRPEHREGA